MPVTASTLSGLQAVYASLGGVGWTSNSGWMSANDPCSLAPNNWAGITCDSAGLKIRSLYFGNNVIK